jgi:outer membrane protein W
MASDNWYLGQVAWHYILDTDAVNEGNVEGSQVGLQLGKHLTNNVALEIGYGEGISHDDIKVTSLTAILWFGTKSDSWRPYGLLGGNYYDFDATNNLSVDHKLAYGRAIARVGVGTMVNQN